MGQVGAFAEQAFALRGDPGAIDASAQIWAQFAADADGTAADLRALDADDFQGDEADTYRSRINNDLPPYLDTTSQAWTIVGGALRTYASTLADLQTQLNGLRTTAWTQWQTASAADAAACQAETDDQAHTADRQHQTETLKPGQKLPADTYRPAGANARSSASGTTAAYQATVSAAQQLRAQHTQAMNACADAIDRATAMRFADPPSWLGHLWEKACDWVADHIDILQTLSAVLKQISSIAGMLAMIPILAPLAGPVAAGTGMLAFGIDTGIKITTGQGNWTDIALTGMSFIPGAKAALATDLLTTTNDAAHGNLDWTQLAATAAFGAAGRKAGHGSHADSPGPARHDLETTGPKPETQLPEPEATSAAEKQAEIIDDPSTQRNDGALDGQEAQAVTGGSDKPGSDDLTDSEDSPEDGTADDQDVLDQTNQGDEGKETEDIAKWPPSEPVDDPLYPALLKKREHLSEDQQFLLDYNPNLPGIPNGWEPRVALFKKGWVWQKPETPTDSVADSLRIMGPNDLHPKGYVRFTNSKGDYLDAAGNPTDDLDLTHIDRDSTGGYPIPKGWQADATSEAVADTED